jgi:cell division protein FtsQ
LAAVSGAWWLWQSGWIGHQAERTVVAAYRFTADLGLAVDDVLVEGRRRTRRSAILDALEVGRGSPTLAFDPRVAKERLEALPWIRQVRIERRLPDTIFVKLIEREPLALWQVNGKISVIDDGGEVIAGAEAGRFTDLLLVVGEGAPRHAATLLRVLESEPDLRGLVDAAVWVGGRRWNIRLEGGIDVRLPESDLARAWAQFARIERQHGLLDRDVAVIDLRLPDRLVVRTTPGAGPRAGKGKDT